MPARQSKRYKTNCTSYNGKERIIPEGNKHQQRRGFQRVFKHRLTDSTGKG